MLLEINSLHIKGSFIFCVVWNYFRIYFPGKLKLVCHIYPPRDVTKCELFLPPKVVYNKTTSAITLLLPVCPLQDTSGTPANGPVSSSACKNQQSASPFEQLFIYLTIPIRKEDIALCILLYKASVSDVQEETAALVHPRFQSSCGDLVFLAARRKIKEACQSSPTLLLHLNTTHALVAAVLT